MGFGTIVANIFMFISVMLIATAAITVFNSNIEKNTNSMNMQSERLKNQIDTDIGILSAVYNNQTQKITIIATNKGKTTLDIGKIDVFIDGFFIPRDTHNRTIRVLPSTEIRNIGYWDNSENIEIIIEEELDILKLHMCAITTQYGTKEESRIDIP
jgi:archaellum component FlaF (FlaF/FlaG flagellin family)